MECLRCEKELTSEEIHHDYAGNEWCEECLSEETARDFTNNLSDLNEEQKKELDGYIEDLITLRAYVDIFIARNNLDEDEVFAKFEEDFEEAMSRQRG